MKEIGGFFPYVSKLSQPNTYFEDLCPEGGELQFLMSGRCANYFALQDHAAADTKKVAYVPLYTCETVLEPFVKAGYELVFYDFNKNMTPIFDDAVLPQISIISICGYYGFSRYDRSFLKKCKAHGVCILEDTTHSMFSKDGVYEDCDYIVGSLRKWIGVSAGGFAIKTHGKFLLEPKNYDPEHLKLRTDAISAKTSLLAREPEGIDEKLAEATDTFWSAERMLRQIFDAQASDKESVEIIHHFDYDTMKQKRRENYQYLLDHFPKSPALKIVYDVLDDATVPSHFTLYAKDRDVFMSFMKEHRVSPSIYWPVGPRAQLERHPDAAYIYNHVISLCCDQRYTFEDMQYLCDTASSFLLNA